MVITSAMYSILHIEYRVLQKEGRLDLNAILANLGFWIKRTEMNYRREKPHSSIAKTTYGDKFLNKYRHLLVDYLAWGVQCIAY